MTEMALESVKVHVTGSDIPLAQPIPSKKRRGVTLRTFVLTTNDPVQQILPLNLNRCEAHIQSVGTSPKDFSIYTSSADAQSGGNSGVTVPAANTAPYPLHTTDAVWATATNANLPVTISVSSLIEGD